MNRKFSWPAIYIVVGITLLSLIPLSHLKFEFNIEKLFPANDPDLAFFQEFQHQFQSGIDDEFIFIGLKNKQGIFQQDFLKKADSLTRYISGLENIIKVYSLTSSNLIYFKGDSLQARPLIHISQPERYQEDSIYLFRSMEYRDLLVSKDGRSIAIAAFNTQNLGDEQKDRILDGIQSTINHLGFDEAHLTAKIRVERIYVQEIEKNLRIYLLLSLTMISLCLYLLFRSVKAIVVPLLIIMVSIIWTLSFISLTGHSLDIISSLLPPILAAICMSDIIHLSTAYVEELRNGLTKMEALKKAFREVGLATFFTCCTVAIGFFTLAITNIIPIRNFGLFAGIGLLMAFVLTLVSLFAFYSLTPVPSIAAKRSADKKWTAALSSLLVTVIRNRYLVLISLLVLTVVSVFFMRRIEINSSLLQEIPKNNPMLEDYRFMEKDFAGTRPFELALGTKGKSNFYELEMMKRVEEIEQFLKDSCGVGYVISPVSLFKGANKAFNGGKIESFDIPSSPQAVARYYEGIMQSEFADEMEHYLSADGNRLRISGRLPDLDMQSFQLVRDRFDRFFLSRGYASLFTYQLTGSGVLLDKVTYSLTENLMTGILVDAVIISLIALFLLRHWRIILIVLVPNVVPLLVMGAVMGILGINLKSDTSVIFAIAFGIAVDDTIHFLSRIRLELSRGISLPYAVKRTYLSTGKAIVITALVLVSGFGTLLFSSFGGAFYIGLLISLCLSVAVIMDLTVLPVLLLLFYKRN
jgi:predicted RND superfamily exporter protein